MLVISDYAPAYELNRADGRSNLANNILNTNSNCAERQKSDEIKFLCACILEFYTYNLWNKEKKEKKRQIKINKYKNTISYPFLVHWISVLAKKKYYKIFI